MAINRGGKQDEKLLETTIKCALKTSEMCYKSDENLLMVGYSFIYARGQLV